MDGDICAGCFRTLDEISRWSQASDEEKQGILLLATTRKMQIGCTLNETADKG